MTISRKYNPNNQLIIYKVGGSTDNAQEFTIFSDSDSDSPVEILNLKGFYSLDLKYFIMSTRTSQIRYTIYNAGL